MKRRRLSAVPGVIASSPYHAARFRCTHLRGYIGSMAVSADGRIIAASAPKAGHVLYVDLQTAKVISQSALKDVCGIAPEGVEDFAASNGFGMMRYETPRASIISEVELRDIAFDNHLRRVV